jgi:hypothetical protein
MKTKVERGKTEEMNQLGLLHIGTWNYVTGELPFIYLYLKQAKTFFFFSCTKPENRRAEVGSTSGKREVAGKVVRRVNMKHSANTVYTCM